ncbi:Ig-like domain-containing protein [Mucilaginibacter ginkgonis]|uniref:Gliding motility-associated C-terminal domain-containing protein n=1 Tax=Mucilaginibacter ginkgonis TaxID=2682091 RepID=A0A6I4HVN7_9SPHI|nr:PKD-like domain-containing protein [Mucilaginibacter ginkgonis]QQL50315.1 gliding motility-associated C-terminal domain-containing protein [Mucilaginibacter ginkgonis]
MKRLCICILLLLFSAATFAQNCIQSVAVNASSNTLCAGSSVTITAVPSGGSGTYSYQWNTGEVTSTITVTTPGTYTVTVTDGNAACGPASNSVTITNPSFLRVSDVFICGNSAATLTASGADSYQWYDTPGGNLLSTQASFTTPVLNASTIYYVVGTKAGCQTSPIAVRANVTALPDAPTAPSVSICAGSAATLSASSSTGIVFDWYTTPTGGTSLITSSDFTTPALTATTTYYVQTYNGSCPGPRTAVTVTVNPVPAKPQATGQTVCYNSSATLSATATSGIIKWFDSTFGNTPLATGASFQTPALTASTTFYVEAMDDQTGCASARVSVIVTVMPQVPHPTAPGTIVCTGNAATLTATSIQNGATFQWYDAASGGTLLSSAPTFITPPLSAETTYYVQSTYQGCVSLRTPVTVSVVTQPATPTVTGTAAVCAGNPASITASGAASYQWYDAATGGNLLYTGTTFVTPALSTSTSFYVQAVNGQCASVRVKFDVTVTPSPATPVVSGPTTAVCQGTATTLTATANGPVSWYDAATGGNVVATGNTFVTPALQATTTYYAETDNSSCNSARTPFTITVTPIPDPVFTYSSGTICQTAGGTRTPIIASGVTGPFTFTATPAGLNINPSTGVITVATSLPLKYTITLTSASNSCINASVSLQISPGGGQANFSYGQANYCQYGANPTPSFPPGSYAGAFSSAPAGLVFVDNTDGQIDLTASKPGTYTITNRLLCAGTSATATVTILPRPAINAGPDQYLASGTPAQLAGTAESTSSIVRWSGGTGTFSNPNILNPVYTPSPGESTATLTLTTVVPASDLCGAQSDQVVLTFAPLAPPTADGVTVCAGSVATVTATAPGGSYQWFATATGGTPLSGNNPFTVSPTVTTTYYVQTTFNGVTSARTPVTVTVTPAPNVTVTGNVICFDNKATLTATADVPGGTFQWFDANNVLLFTGPTYTTTFLQQNTTYYVQYVSLPCSSPLTPVNVTVNPLPTITSPLTAETCSATALNYHITSATTGVAYTWSRDAVTGIDNAAATGQTADITETLVNSTNNPINVVYTIVASSNSCSSNPFKLVVTVNPALKFTSSATQEICNGTSTNYQIQLNFTPTSISWSRAAVAGIRNPAISGQTSPTIHEILYNTTTAPVTVNYIYTAQSSGCASSTFNLAVIVDPAVRVNSPAAETVCSGTALNYKITSATPGTTFNWTRGGANGITNDNVSITNANTITETLINTTPDPIKVTYLITPVYNGCPGVVYAYVVTVNPTPPLPVITAPDRVCTGGTLTLNGPAVAGAIYAWTGPNNFTSALQSPSINNLTIANAGDYKLTLTLNGCVGPTATKTIGVDVQPVAAAGPDQTVCVGHFIQLHGTITGGISTGIWTTTGTGTFGPSNTDLNAIYMPSADDATKPNLVFTLTASALGSCTIATSNTTVTLVPAPTVNAGGNQNICDQNTVINLTAKTANAKTYLWTTTGTGKFITAANQPNATYLISTDDLKKGSVSFMIAATNDYCTSYDTKTVTFLPPPVVSAGKKLTYVLRGTAVTLEPTVNESNVTYLWSPGTYLNDVTAKNPIFTAIADQTFTLTVTDTLGCVSSAETSYIVLDPIVTYNTFTPNGDGVNDFWNIPALNSYPGAKVDIYNRYGRQVFHSIGYGTPWDGTFEGAPVPTGVYYYVITTKFSSQVYSGYVTVLR